MKWTLRPVFTNWFIWVGKNQGRWLASVAPIPLRPGVEPEGPGLHMLDGDFDTAIAAEKAAQGYIAKLIQS